MALDRCVLHSSSSGVAFFSSRPPDRIDDVGSRRSASSKSSIHVGSSVDAAIRVRLRAFCARPASSQIRPSGRFASSRTAAKSVAPLRGSAAPLLLSALLRTDAGLRAPSIAPSPWLPFISVFPQYSSRADDPH
ncbi:hypothetical protein FA95DRAFT_1614142 [Auriscalpium vulgare]|uniref:Uncharacterized protein n=1 Tax=Auriscalpium vulgare TaxID=40419 RepID=A0ACB8R054_9AGAM|nr:hypothetical protein FA95DRAFT_1614142 [Auriscalpium vulgare]